MNQRRRGILNNLEYHVLLALADRTLYGYALKEAIEVESRGAVAPRAGSLYRVLARLMSRGLVREAEPDATVGRHPGLERKYYALTPMGRKALAVEATRLREAATLAEQRLGLANSS